MSTRPMRLEIIRAASSKLDHVQDDGSRVYTFVNGWRWRVKATNSQILCHSETYRRLGDCAHGAGLVTGLDGPAYNDLGLFLRPGWSGELLAYRGYGSAYRVVVDK